MNSQPIFNAVDKHIKQNIAPFHMPGHKGVNILPGWKKAMPYDITELPDTDSLYEANGVIELSQQIASHIYKTKRTLYSAGGCTLCIQAMLRLVSQNSNKIIMGRNIHRSAINALALLGIDPIWIMPSFDAGYGLPGRINAVDIKKALADNPDASAVYITSPDYYGCISPINEISKICKQYNIPLIIDNAHGAHLIFIDKGKLHPIQNGADMSADSVHKTLPALTGSALLHINNDKYIDNAQSAMALFGSTSPSYLIMQSLESAINWANQSDRFTKLIALVDDIKQTAINKGFLLPKGLNDPTRITLDCAAVGMSGYKAAEYFRNNKIEPEMSTRQHIVFIPTPLNTAEHFIRLKAAIENFPVSASLKNEVYIPILPQKILSPRHAILSQCQRIDTISSQGRIAAESACPCPPGVPIVMPGEIITHEAVQTLIGYGVLSILVVK